MNKGRMIRNSEGWSIFKGIVAVSESVQNKQTLPADHRLVILNFSAEYVE